MNVIRNASLFGLLSLALAFVPLGTAIVYAWRPTERHPPLMRPRSLAGLINALMPFWRLGFTTEAYTIVAIGAAESLVHLFVGFASLTAAWLLVAVGMSRTGDIS